MEEAQRRHIILSGDGSPTIFSENFNESYHSVSGARQESRYLFIENALMARADAMAGATGRENLRNRDGNIIIKVLEYGFGTGLNALLTLNALADKELPSDVIIEYTALEKYPLTPEEYESLNYGESARFLSLHEAPWSEKAGKAEFTETDRHFRLRKILCDFSDFVFGGELYDVIYFDPFSPDTQPLSWSGEIFGRISKGMSAGAILATYSAKGIVKRALREAGLIVHRIAGTGTKRHNVLAVKPI